MLSFGRYAESRACTEDIAYGPSRNEICMVVEDILEDRCATLDTQACRLIRDFEESSSCKISGYYLLYTR